MGCGVAGPAGLQDISLAQLVRAFPFFIFMHPAVLEPTPPTVHTPSEVGLDSGLPRWGLGEGVSNVEHLRLWLQGGDFSFF